MKLFGVFSIIKSELKDLDLWINLSYTVNIYTDGVGWISYHLNLNSNIKFCICSIHLDLLVYTLSVYKRFTLFDMVYKIPLIGFFFYDYYYFGRHVFHISMQFQLLKQLAGRVLLWKWLNSFQGWSSDCCWCHSPSYRAPTYTWFFFFPFNLVTTSN